MQAITTFARRSLRSYTRVLSSTSSMLVATAQCPVARIFNYHSSLPSSRSMSTHSSSVSLTAILGSASKTITIPVGAEQIAVVEAVQKSFNLPVEESATIRLFSSDDYDARLLTDDDLHGSAKVFVRSDRHIFVEFSGEVHRVAYRPGWISFFELRNHCVGLFNLTQVPSNCLALFKKTTSGVVNLKFSDCLPGIDEDSAAGFSHKYPILLRRTDLIKVKLGASTLTVSTADCATYEDVANAIQKAALPVVIPPSSLALRYTGSKLIKLDSAIPAYAVNDEKKVLHAVRTDLVKVKLGASTLTVSTADCVTYEDVANAIQKAALPVVIPPSSLALRYPGSKLIKLDSAIPAYSLGDEKKVLHAVRTDLISVGINRVDYTVSIAGCKTYLDVAEVIRKFRFPKATCAEQLMLYYGRSNPLDLQCRVPPYSVGDEKKGLHARMMVKKVVIVDYEGDESSVETIFTSDSDILDISGGLVEVEDDIPVEGQAAVRSLHMLKEGASYIRKMRLDSDFSGWSNANGKVTLNEVGVAMRRFFDPDMKFTRLLPRRIKYGDSGRCEWDAAFHYSKANDEERLIIVEARHNFTWDRFEKTMRLFNKLPEIFENARTVGYKLHKDKPITLVLAADIFEERVAGEALKEAELIESSKRPDDIIYLCYPDGYPYSVKGSVEATEDFYKSFFLSELMLD